MYNVGSNLCPAPEMSYKAREMIDESLRSESKKHRFGSQLPLSALEIFLWFIINGKGAWLSQLMWFTDPSIVDKSQPYNLFINARGPTHWVCYVHLRITR